VVTIIGQGIDVRNLIIGAARMGIARLMAAAILACSGIFADIAIANEEPPVKMSKSGICHAQGTTYYSKTKNYTAYNTLEACLRAGRLRVSFLEYDYSLI
jgi:hypothetical protein